MGKENTMRSRIEPQLPGNPRAQDTSLLVETFASDTSSGYNRTAAFVFQPSGSHLALRRNFRRVFALEQKIATKINGLKVLEIFHSFKKLF